MADQQNQPVGQGTQSTVNPATPAAVPNVTPVVVVAPEVKAGAPANTDNTIATVSPTINNSPSQPVDIHPTSVVQNPEPKQNVNSGQVEAEKPATEAAKPSDTDKALTGINRDLEEKITMEKAQEIAMPYINVGVFPVNPDILHLVSPEDAKRAMAMLFYKVGKKVRLAVADPNSPETQALVKDLEGKGYGVQMNLASRASVTEAFKFYTSDQYKLKTEIKNTVSEEEIHYEKELENLAALKDKIAALPSEEALNTLNVSAIKAGASDIHYQPEETLCTVRFRIDGVLHTVFDIPKETYTNLANQLKYKAKMKLNITNVPQDGRFRFIVNERKIDVRVSALPTEYGESFVCRILDSGKHFANFEELGFSKKSLEVLRRATELSQGMVLVTGPTGSGKTTTLYVLLNKINTQDTKIITLEDPIEYHLTGITQSQVNEKRGYTFADGLRSILRQDPDVVMIGEIRDLETAEVCAQASLTGHVLLSTLHTNSAVGTIPRLINIGLPAFMVAPALSVIVAQRLVRRLCTCSEEVEIKPEEKIYLETTLAKIKEVDPAFEAAMPAKIKKVKGCEACNFTGFRGQITISEVLDCNDEIKNAVLKNASSSDLLLIARKNGMLTMEEDGILKVIEGSTTIDEVHRVTNT
ncbi:MAG: GspE/PulE family protein [Candidatus Gracilibacteria bacterium]